MADFNKKGERITLEKLSISPEHPSQIILKQYEKGRKNEEKKH